MVVKLSYFPIFTILFRRGGPISSHNHCASIFVKNLYTDVAEVTPSQ